jgi:hypothetical protein
MRNIILGTILFAASVTYGDPSGSCKKLSEHGTGGVVHVIALRNSDIFFDGVQVTASQLPIYLREAKQEDANTVIHLIWKPSAQGRVSDIAAAILRAGLEVSRDCPPVPF